VIIAEPLHHSGVLKVAWRAKRKSVQGCSPRCTNMPYGHERPLYRSYRFWTTFCGCWKSACWVQRTMQFVDTFWWRLCFCWCLDSVVLLRLFVYFLSFTTRLWWI